MSKFYILGKYTAKGLGGFVSNPDTDRKAATTALMASAGGKLTGYAGLRGKYDFIVEGEGTFDLETKWNDWPPSWNWWLEKRERLGIKRAE